VIGSDRFSQKFVEFVAVLMATNSTAHPTALFGVRQLAAALVRMEMFHRP